MFRRRRAVDDDAFDDDAIGSDGFDDGGTRSDGGADGGVPDGTALGDELLADDADLDAASGDGRPQGPWDVADAPEDELLDLGGLRVPVIDGFDIGVTAEQDIPVVVSYAAADGMMQLHAFAAPRSAGIWDDVRAEIADSLKQGGGRAHEAQGPFGTELAATIPMQTREGAMVSQPARFIGVDGPRWFLRALVTGPIIDNHSRMQALHDVIRRVVVVRGTEAMAPREVIPLRLPREVVQAMAEAEAEDADAEDAEAEDAEATGYAGQPEAEGGTASSTQSEDAAQRPRLTMPERGPEITEVR